MHHSRAMTPLARLYLFLFFLSLAGTASGQRGGLNDPGPLNQTIISYNTAPGTGIVIFNVYSERTSVHLDRQALLKLIRRSDISATWQTTEESKGIFTDLPFGTYDIEVNAVGYLGAHKEVQVMNSLRPAEVDVVLHADPAAVDLDLATAVLSPKARKETKRAITLLKSSHLPQAQKELDEAYKLAPASPDVNFLLGYLFFQMRDYPQSSTYLQTATKLSPRTPQSWTLLGRADLEIEHYTDAQSALEQSVALDGDNWLPHDLLADSYLHQKSYEKARDEARVAIDKGKTEASSAQLILGESLIGLGEDQAGVDALKSFLQQSPRDPMAGQVRDLIAELTSASSPGPSSIPTPSSKLSAVDPLTAVPSPSIAMKSWRPPGVDDIKPAVASSVACPSEKVIDESGKRVQQLVDDVSRFAAVEELFHQALDSYGIPVRTENRKFNYVATISEPKPGFLVVDEYRADKLGLAGYPDQIASAGFAALALVFHPDMRDNFAFTCEGLGDLRSAATWLVHFRQREDRPNRMHSYKVGNRYYPVPLKGRAWISADTFQIMRMEADMVGPMPEIQLLSEHQVVEYGSVPFPKKNTTLWLPKSAEIYLDFRKHRYYRRHSFDHYMLYSVDSEEKRKEPHEKTNS